MKWTKTTDALPPHLKPVMVSVTAGSPEEADLWHEFAWDENEKKKPRTLMEDWNECTGQK